ncbi:MAG: thioesterase family protein [Acidobacteriota bacterium]|nr:thioesterase family protein [Acidobacteriota bacterium]
MLDRSTRCKPAHFVDAFDVSEWLLIVTEATQASDGRVYGGGSVFTGDGRLVATFHQDSMAKAANACLDPNRAM